MKTEEIANQLVALLKQGNFEGAQRELFHSDVVSTEPQKVNLPQTKGLDKILEEGAQFRESVEAWNGISVSEPNISMNHFSIALKVDLTFKGQEPSSMDEIIVYEVVDGKIVNEVFYY